MLKLVAIYLLSYMNQKLSMVFLSFSFSFSFLNPLYFFFFNDNKHLHSMKFFTPQFLCSHFSPWYVCVGGIGTVYI